MNAYNTIIPVTPTDFCRLRLLYGRLIDSIQGRVLFVGSKEVGDLCREYEETLPLSVRERMGWVDEESVLSFTAVHALMEERLAPLLGDDKLPKGVTGWYYQQFLKLQYARVCKDEYYMTWDGDTIPCREVHMFQDGSGKPYFDMKAEMHEGYFETLGRILPGVQKVVSRSFISEHMLFKRAIVLEMLAEIESNTALAGDAFWEKILHAIPVERLQESDFSEFETYGSYCVLRHMGEYALREWHSFRLGGQFFTPQTITDSDMAWIAKDFDAISFEKGHVLVDGHERFFSNVTYQQKLSARQMLEAMQDYFDDGYVEVWERGSSVVTGGEMGRSIEKKAQTGEADEERLRYLSPTIYLEYEALGDRLMEKNIDQAYLCYENAAFLAVTRDESVRLEEKKRTAAAQGAKVKKTCIIILSFNNKYLIQKCVESILMNCSPESYSLVLFDNASLDGTAEWLTLLDEEWGTEQLRVVLSKENLGFAAGCNAAVEYAAKDEDLFFLNDDTRLPANALFWLRMGLYESSDVGAVGSMQNYSGSDQLVNVSFDLPEQYMEFGAAKNVYLDKAYEEKPKLSGFAYLVHGDIFRDIGGFDEEFSPGYFEDDDLSFRIRRAGYRLLLCHNSFIYHAGSQSFIKRSDLAELFDRNRKKIMERWGFDSADYATLCGEELEMIEQIKAEGYKEEDSFSLLYMGAGCGNALGRIAWLYPRAELFGVESNSAAREMAIQSIPIVESRGISEGMEFDVIVIRNRSMEEGQQIEMIVQRQWEGSYDA